MFRFKTTGLENVDALRDDRDGQTPPPAALSLAIKKLSSMTRGEIILLASAQLARLPFDYLVSVAAEILSIAGDLDAAHQSPDQPPNESSPRRLPGLTVHATPDPPENPPGGPARSR